MSFEQEVMRRYWRRSGVFSVLFGILCLGVGLYATVVRRVADSYFTVMIVGGTLFVVVGAVLFWRNTRRPR